MTPAELETERTRIASRAVALGEHFAVIPLCHPWAPAHGVEAKNLGKIPVPGFGWKQYQDHKPTAAEVSRWFSRDPRDLGLLTGPVNGIVAIDADDGEAVAWCREHLPPTPLRVATARGEHWFYRWDPDHPIGNKARLDTGDGRKQVDIRGAGGYVVGVDSRHQSGAVYRLIGEADFTPETVATLPLLPPELVAGAIKTPPPPAEFRYTGNGDLSGAAEQARQYFKGVPPAVQGEGGDHRTFVAACRLRRGFGLSEEEAYPILAEWNTGCVPPWSEKGLREKLKNAVNYGKGVFGGMVREPRQRPPGRAKTNGSARPAPEREPGTGPGDEEPPDAFFDEDPSFLEPDLQTAGPQPRAPLSIDILSLLAKKIQPREAVIENLMYAAEPVMIAGFPGVRKSWLAVAMGLSIAAGKTSFCGRAIPRKRPVLYIDAEQTEIEAQERDGKILRGLRIQHKDIIPFHHLIVGALSPNDPALPDGFQDLNEESMQAFIEDELAVTGAEVLFLDSARLLFDLKDENKSESWRPLNCWLNKLSGRGITVIVLHHASRAEDFNGHVAAITRVATVLLLTAEEDSPTVNVKFRKHRSFPVAAAKPFTATLEDEPDGAVSWSFEGGQTPREQAYEFFNRGGGIKDAQQFASLPTLYRWIEEGIRSGELLRDPRPNKRRNQAA